MLHFFIVRLGLTELSDAFLKNQINFVLIADYKGGKPKISRKTFYYESIHAKRINNEFSFAASSNLYISSFLPLFWQRHRNTLRNDARSDQRRPVSKLQRRRLC